MSASPASEGQRMSSTGRPSWQPTDAPPRSSCCPSIAGAGVPIGEPGQRGWARIKVLAPRPSHARSGLRPRRDLPRCSRGRPARGGSTSFGQSPHSRTRFVNEPRIDQSSLGSPDPRMPLRITRRAGAPLTRVEMKRIGQQLIEFFVRLTRVPRERCRRRAGRFSDGMHVTFEQSYRRY